MSTVQNMERRTGAPRGPQLRLAHGWSAAFLLWSAAAAPAATVSLVPVADSELRQFGADLNFGSAPTMVSGALGIPANFEIRRALLRFDLSGQIPAGAFINSATLTVRVMRVPMNPANANFGLHRLLPSWSEGDVTWNSRLPATPWQTPGATGPLDSVATASATVFVSDLGSYTFASTPALVADVQGWVNDPASNFGWLLQSADEVTPRTARHFATREDSSDNAPVLVVDYSLAPPSPPAIVTQPQSQNAFVGDTVSFNVQATGTAPLSYQWHFNGAPKPGATTATLILSGVQTNDSGNYTVVVANQLGSVTSAPAILTVLPRPQNLPVVTVLSPTNGARFGTENVILLSAQATNGIITRLQFVLDGNSIGGGTNNPFTVLLTNATPGVHSLVAVATDAQGSNTPSAAVLFSAFAPPTVELSGPAAGSRLQAGSNVIVSAQVTNAGVRIQQVDFYSSHVVTNATTGAVTNDIQKIGSSLAAPFQITWPASFLGTNQLSAQALDEFGQTGRSAPVAVVVYFPENVPPTVRITNAPPNFARRQDPRIVLEGTAADNRGVDRVEVQLNNGRFQPVDGTTAWHALLVLAPGPNAVVVRSVDQAGNPSAPLTRFYTYVLQATLRIDIEGSGTVAPNLDRASLEVGKVYRVTARPAAGQLFRAWLGAPYQGPVLNFRMQTNLVLTAQFTTNHFLEVQGQYAGLFFETNQVQPESSGFASLQLGRAGGFTAKFVIEGVSFPLRGQFDSAGHARTAILRRGQTPVALDLQVDLAGSSGISGRLTDGTWVADLHALRNDASVPASPGTPAAKETFVALDASDGTQVGSGTLAVQPKGQVRFGLVLAGGRRLTASTARVADSTAPIYLSLSPQELMLGQAQFPDGAALPITGEILWIRAGQGGFSKTLEIQPAGQ